MDTLFCPINWTVEINYQKTYNKTEQGQRPVFIYSFIQLHKKRAPSVVRCSAGS